MSEMFHACPRGFSLQKGETSSSILHWNCEVAAARVEQRRTESFLAMVFVMLNLRDFQGFKIFVILKDSNNYGKSREHVA